MIKQIPGDSYRDTRVHFTRAGLVDGKKISTSCDMCESTTNVYEFVSIDDDGDPDGNSCLCLACATRMNEAEFDYKDEDNPEILACAVKAHRVALPDLTKEQLRIITKSYFDLDDMWSMTKDELIEELDQAFLRSTIP